MPRTFLARHHVELAGELLVGGVGTLIALVAVGWFLHGVASLDSYDGLVQLGGFTFLAASVPAVLLAGAAIVGAIAVLKRARWGHALAGTAGAIVAIAGGAFLLMVGFTVVVAAVACAAVLGAALIAGARLMSSARLGRR